MPKIGKDINTIIAVTKTAPIKFNKKPARIISLISIQPELNTIALGGVATGSIKAKDAEISKLSGDLAVAQGNVATLKASISTQNKALEALKAEKAALDASVREKALTAQQNRGQTLSIDGEGVDSMNNFFERLFK